MVIYQVAVIGAGAAGLAAARHLSADPQTFSYVVYEQTDQLGGTWVYTEDVGTDKLGQPVHTSMYKWLRYGAMWKFVQTDHPERTKLQPRCRAWPVGRVDESTVRAIYPQLTKCHRIT